MLQFSTITEWLKFNQMQEAKVSSKSIWRRCAIRVSYAKLLIKTTGEINLKNLMASKEQKAF